MGAPWLVRSDLPGLGGAPTHVLLVLSSLTLYRLRREVRRKRATEFEDFIDSDKKILVIPSNGGVASVVALQVRGAEYFD
jgi:hypothetical protein